MKMIAIIMAPNQRLVNTNNCIACIPERIEMLLKDNSIDALDQGGYHGAVSDPRNFTGRDMGSLRPDDKQKLEQADKVFFARVGNNAQQHLAVRDKSGVNSQEFDLRALTDSAVEYIGVDQSSLYAYFGYMLN